MTPCVKQLKKSKIEYILHQYAHDESSQSYGEEAAQKLSIAPERVFKTLVVMSEAKDFAVGIVPVSSMLSMKLMAKALDVKKVMMADAKDVEKISGYVLGGVSPIGQKKSLKTIIDISAKNFVTVFVSAGKRGLEVELSAEDLKSLINAKLEAICQS
ncbi:MAG: Cys-tRNA(Pro) deacylase [Sulfurimonas sp.]|jgi:Cys-tRNA(Pro)/Cys-tRNA(Cys) deacylase